MDTCIFTLYTKHYHTMKGEGRISLCAWEQILNLDSSFQYPLYCKPSRMFLCLQILSSIWCTTYSHMCTNANPRFNLIYVHHTSTAWSSLWIHSKARKFIQHMRSKCANCSWMLMASRRMEEHKTWTVDIFVTKWHWKGYLKYLVGKFSVHRPPKPCAALDLLAQGFPGLFWN